MSEKHFRILLIEDNLGDVRLIQEMLGESSVTRYEVEQADRLSSVLELLTVKTFDGILLNLDPPDTQGLQTLDCALAKTSRLPVVVLTGHNNEMTGIKAAQKRGSGYTMNDVIGKNPRILKSGKIP